MVGKVTVKIFCVWGLNAIQKWLDSPEDESSEMLLRDLVIKFAPHFPPPPTPFSVSFFIVCARYDPLCCYIFPCCSPFVNSDVHRLHSETKTTFIPVTRQVFGNCTRLLV
jgi:hypothetical protein